MQQGNHLRPLAAAVALALAGASGAAVAQQERPDVERVSHTFLELSAMQRDIDVFEQSQDIADFADGEGALLRGSFAVTDNFFIFGDASWSDSEVAFADGTQEDVDVYRLDAGIGYNVEIAPRSEFVARVGYSRMEFDFTADPEDIDLGRLEDEDQDGAFVDLGVTNRLSPKLETGVGVQYVNYDDFDDTTIMGRVSFMFTPNWAVSGVAHAGDEIRRFELGVRLMW